MKIAVTGASGHIGSNLCRELIHQGYSVKALVHRSDQGIKDLPLEFVKGDVMDPASLSSLVQGTDVVFHLAAVISIQVRKEEELFEKNVKGTKNIIKAAKEEGVQRLIHFSSIHALVHEPFDHILDENRALALKDKIQYSRSKALAEQAVTEAVKEGLDAVILSPTAVIGPSDYAPSLLGRALILMYNGKIPALVRGGYDWVDVRDVAQAAVMSIKKGEKGERYLLSGHWKTLCELAELICKIKGEQFKKLTCSIGLARFGLPFLKLYGLLSGTPPLYTKDSLKILKTGHNHISCEKANRCFGYTRRPIEDTLRDTFEWFRSNRFMD
ncbi:MAG: NAD-dependent epimerase/dehydratase family protein [Candidatus Aminicenantes bacterium]|nr:MAG: NAD-dependent epimerase/dehydratase family protein [Candidatus Aminicenantes bacterium]